MQIRRDAAISYIHRADDQICRDASTHCSCGPGVIVIWRQWLALKPHAELPRLHRDDNPVRPESLTPLENSKAIFFLLMNGTRLLCASELLADLVPLLRLQETSARNSDWRSTLAPPVRQPKALLR